MKVGDIVKIIGDQSFTSSKESYCGKIGVIKNIIINPKTKLDGKLYDIQPLYPVVVWFNEEQFLKLHNDSDFQATFKMSEIEITSIGRLI